MLILAIASLVISIVLLLIAIFNDSGEFFGMGVVLWICTIGLFVVLERNKPENIIFRQVKTSKTMEQISTGIYETQVDSITVTYFSVPTKGKLVTFKINGKPVGFCTGEKDTYTILSKDQLQKIIERLNE